MLRSEQPVLTILGERGHFEIKMMSGPFHKIPNDQAELVTGIKSASVHMRNFRPLTHMKSGDTTIKESNLTKIPGENFSLLLIQETSKPFYLYVNYEKK